MNKDKVDNFAGRLRLPWGNKYMDEEAFLRGDIPSAYDRPTVTSVLKSDGTYSQEAAPGATDSEFDAKQIVYPAGALVHQPAGALVGGSGNGGNDGGNWDQDPKFLRGARYGEIPANFISNQISDVVDRFLNRSDEVDPYEAGRIEREEQEWGKGGQPSASDQIDTYERSKWLQKTRNSPAARSGAFTDDERWQQQLKHRQWLEDNNRL